MNLINRIYNIVKRTKIAPQEKDAKESCIDVSDDITTYIRCLFHDFRGPLNNISMAVDVLLDSTTKTSSDFDTLQTIKDSCVFMSESLDGFLNLQNIQNSSELIELKYEPFHIVGLIKKVQYILMFNIINKKIEIKYSIKPIHEWVIGDHKHIQHVLINLLSNAVKFAETKSKIIIRLEANPIVNKKQRIIISVIDENSWISPSIKHKLFQKYVTSDNVRGTGLGLYICRKIIELHGGTITHNNYRGRTGSDHEIFTGGTSGNIFKIELDLEVCASGSDKAISDKNTQSVRYTTDRNSPDSSNNAKIHNEPPKNNSELLLQQKNKHDMLKFVESSHNLSSERRVVQSIKLPMDKSGHNNNPLDSDSLTRPKCDVVRKIEPVKKVKVFIIDDSELSRKLMKRLFEQNCDKMKLYEAEDGLDAILKLIDRINSVNLILLDNIMPNITGVLLSKILRGIGYKGLIFGITGNGLDADRKEFLAAGANYVFTKPFNREKFDQMIYFIQNNGYETVGNGIIVETEPGKLAWEI